MLNKAIIIKNLIALFLFLGQGIFCFGQTQEYKIDLANSTVTFLVSHMGVLTVTGEFQEFSGTLGFDEQELLSIESSIVVESINTKDNSRDTTLKSEGYLDVKNYPLIIFTSTDIKVTSSSKTIKGSLKIKGVTREIELSYKKIKSKNPELTFIKISTQISRKDFDLDFGPMDVLIGNNVKVELKIVFSKTK